MKRLFAYGAIATSIVLSAFGSGSVTSGAFGINTASQEQIAMSIVPPVPVDNSFIIPVEGDPGDWW